MQFLSDEPRDETHAMMVCLEEIVKRDPTVNQLFDLGYGESAHRESPDEEWTLSHEQYRPFVMFHRIQAEALAELDQEGPESAVAAVNKGLDRLREVFEVHGVEHAFDENELVERLTEFRETLRERFDVGKTLNEQLAEAIADEEYEKAANLRDAIQAKNKEI